MRQTIAILLSDAINFHQDLTREYKNLEGIRDIKLLESAVSNPFQSMFGEDLYKAIEDKAARLAFGIINNHPFIDGNKRTGLHCMLVFLFLNEYIIEYTQEEIEELAVGIAEKHISLAEIAEWIKAHYQQK
jgi:death-on-curing protein